MTDIDYSEYLVAEDVSEMVWLRLRRLTSPNLCRKIISSDAQSIEEDVLERKSAEVASVVKSALDYWNDSYSSLNSAILMRYYSVLQFSIAEQITSSDPKDTLEAIQKHTEHGHGLFTLQNPEGKFPNNYNIGLLKQGHFYSYCKHKGYKTKPYSFERKPKDYSKLSVEEYKNLYSLTDLLRRVPELQPVVKEYLNSYPLSFGVGLSSQDIAFESDFGDELKEDIVFVNPGSSQLKTTLVNIYLMGQDIDIEEIDNLGLPFHSIRKAKNNEGNFQNFIGKIEHPANELFWKHFDHYKSGYSQTCIIAPIAGEIVDPLVLHLMILYSFSIVVRYLPSLWYEIEFGKHNHIYALLEHYISVIDKILPKIILEKLSKRSISVTHPGSIFAPI